MANVTAERLRDLIGADLDALERLSAGTTRTASRSSA
jgi:hypothetical protein